MEQDTLLVPIGQGTPDIPRQVGTGAHLNLEGGPLQSAPPGGRGNPDTSSNGKDLGRTPGRGGDRRGSVVTMHGAVRSYIGDEVRAFEGLDNLSDKVKGSRPTMMGQTGECDKAGITRGAHPGGADDKLRVFHLVRSSLVS